MKKKEIAGKFYCQSFSVPFSYPVHFTKNLFDPDNSLLSDVLSRMEEDRKHRAVIYMDEGVAAAHPDLCKMILAYFEKYWQNLELSAFPCTVPGGEAVKENWNTVHRLINEIGEHRLDRQSYVIAIGGGAVLDAVGFAAAIIHRGLRLVRIPTTTLSQNDAGIGVKNSINELGQKNFIGTFAPPFAVINDRDFLETLSFDQWIAGIAEAYKVAIIKDFDFFDFLFKNAEEFKKRNPELMEESVYRCAVLHLEHIRTNGDPFEFGSARPLDFGHWAAHKLESMSGYSIGHGQAVSIGICMDSYAAMKQGLLKKTETEQILDGFIRTGLPIWHPLLEREGKDGIPEIFQGIESFREHLGGRLTLTLPDGIGKKTEVHHMDSETVKESIKFLLKYSKKNNP